MHYLYRITNQLNEKVYIGQTVNDKRRWAAHKSFAKNPERTGQYIHRAMSKYGSENFTFEVIATCRTQDDADETENMLINQYDSRNSGVGYNLLNGGNRGNWLGRKHSEKSKDKNRAAHLGKKASEETKQKQSQSMKEKCANGWIPVLPNNKGRKGRVSPRKGVTLSEETKKKISESSKGKPAWNKISLSEQQISEIKSLLSDGYSLRKIAQITKIHRGIVKSYTK